MRHMLALIVLCTGYWGQRPVPEPLVVSSAKSLRSEDACFVVLSEPAGEQGSRCSRTGISVKIVSAPLVRETLEALRHAATVEYVVRDRRVIPIRRRNRPCFVAIYSIRSGLPVRRVEASFTYGREREQVGPRFATVIAKLRKEAERLGSQTEVPTVDPGAAGDLRLDNQAIEGRHQG